MEHRGRRGNIRMWKVFSLLLGLAALFGSAAFVRVKAETVTGTEVQPVAATANEEGGSEAANSTGSVYTVTWTVTNAEYAGTYTATLHFVDESGSDISSALGVTAQSYALDDQGNITGLTIDGSTGKNLDDIGALYNGYGIYYYKAAHLDTCTGTEAVNISFNSAGKYDGDVQRHGWTYHDGSSWEKWCDDAGAQKLDTEVDVYLVYGKMDTIETVDSLSKGINISLFDYDAATVNAVTADEFHFGLGTGSGSSQGAWNTWVSGNGSYMEIVRSLLGTDGYPVFAVGDENMMGCSLSYLYAATGNSASETRTDLNHLFSQEEYDATGYYVYDSSLNFATIADNTDSDFTVYSSPYRSADTALSTPKFLPFNTLEDTDTLNEAYDYSFGMTIDFSFIQPKDGYALWTTTDGAGNTETTSEQMVFEFAGDDDVWVFIDGVLVLDLGGVHDPVSGSINFATGVVTVSKVGATDGEYTTTLYELMKSAGQSEEWLAANFTQQDDGTYIFTDYTTHTLNLYYLERGDGGANCRIRFNLQAIPTGYINFQKNLDAENLEYADEIEFVFEVYVDYNGDQSSYKLYSGEYEIYEAGNTSQAVSFGTTTDGTITLKHNQVARLTSPDLTVNYTYYITEVGATSDKYTVTLRGTNITDESGATYQAENGARTTVLTVEDHLYIVFNNQVVVQEETQEPSETPQEETPDTEDPDDTDTGDTDTGGTDDTDTDDTDTDETDAVETTVTSTAVEPVSTDSAATGDSAPLGMLFALAAVCGLGLIVLIIPQALKHKKIFTLLFAVMIGGVLASGMTVSAEEIASGNAEMEEEESDGENAGSGIMVITSSNGTEGETETEGGTTGGSEARAFAIYSDDDKSLRFYKRTDCPAVGDQYNGLTVTAVYTTELEEDTTTDGYLYYYQIPWYEHMTDIEIAVAEDEISPVNLRYWFCDAVNLKTADLSKLDTSQVETMYCTFYCCYNLTSLDVSSWDTSSAVNMDYMFYCCYSLTSLDVSSWDTSNAARMYAIFCGCSGITELDLSTWNTRNLAEDHRNLMFWGMTSLWKITVGSDFVFYGTSNEDGNRFPTPSDDALYSVTGVTGATGNWYNTGNEAYAVSSVPTNTADTYIAYPTYVVTLALPTDGSVSADQETAVSVMGNASYSVVLTAAEGYEISAVTVNGAALAASGSTYTLNVTADATIEVTTTAITVTEETDETVTEETTDDTDDDDTDSTSETESVEQSNSAVTAEAIGSSVPATGDSAPLELLIALAAICELGLIVLIVLEALKHKKSSTGEL